MRVIGASAELRWKPNLRRRLLGRAAAPWWAMLVALLAVLAVLLLTFPTPTGPVSVTIDRAERSAPIGGFDLSSPKTGASLLTDTASAGLLPTS
jgi:hypothetical protein